MATEIAVNSAGYCSSIAPWLRCESCTASVVALFYRCIELWSLLHLRLTEFS